MLITISFIKKVKEKKCSVKETQTIPKMSLSTVNYYFFFPNRGSNNLKYNSVLLENKIEKNLNHYLQRNITSFILMPTSHLTKSIYKIYNY